MKTNIELALEAGVISCGHSVDQEEIAAVDSLVASVEARLMGRLLEGVGEPVAWAHFTDDGNIRMWAKSSRASIEAAIGKAPDGLYTADQKAADVLREREECAKECDVRAGSIARRAGYSEGLATGYKNAAAAIRNRGTK